MKYLISVLLVLPALVFSLLPTAFFAPAAPPASVALADEARAMVVLELFTSQGCSSCPPADALLQRLNERGERSDQLITLSYHVDYWNYLGWEDPFSSPYFSARQTDYTERLGERTYTPQLIINGTKAVVGSRESEVTQLVDLALRTAKPTHRPQLTVATEGRTITASYVVAGATAGYRVTALVVQHRASSAVKRGENRGRELSHHNVVRVMDHAPAAASGSFSLTLPEDLGPEDASVVLLVQDTATHAIVGATSGLLRQNPRH